MSASTFTRVAGACAVCVALSACGGGSTRTTPADSSPAALPSRTTTYIAEIEQPLSVALSGDVIELAGLTGYRDVACVTEPATLPAAPLCRPNESAGTMVEVLPSSGCDDGWLRPEQVPAAYKRALSGNSRKVIAVYEPAHDASLFGAGFDAAYVGVIETDKHEDGSPAGVALHISRSGRVVWLETDCNALSRLLAPSRIGKRIDMPGESVALTVAQTPPAASVIPTPSSSAGESPRPAEVPASATLVVDSVTLGNLAGASADSGRLLYAIRCRGDVVAITTTKETLYAELPCDATPSDHALLNQVVEVRVTPGAPTQVRIASVSAGTIDLNVGRVWLQTR